MKRLMLAAAVLAMAACGRPGDDDEYEETVYDANNPPVVRDTTLDRSMMSRDTLGMGVVRDSAWLDSVRVDSLRQDSIRRGLIRDTMP